MHASRTRDLLPIGLFGALAGCARQTFTPVVPHLAARPGLSVSITRLSFDPPFVVSGNLRAVGHVRLRRVMLAPRVAEPCREGVRDVEFRLDDQRAWARPIDVEGKHEFTLRYGANGAAELLARPSVLDFVVAGEGAEPDQCLRVELTGSRPALAWKDHVVATAGGDIRALAPIQAVDGVGVGGSFGARIGAYLGPIRVRGEAGFGAAHCSSNCYGSDIGFVWLPVGVSMHWFAFESNGAGLDLGLAYRLILSDVGSHGASRAAVLHAPELRVRFASTATLGPGLPQGSRIASGGYELIASEWFGEGPNGPERAFVLGLGIAWDVGL